MYIGSFPIGKFENVSGSFVISDPCYDADVWCRGELNNVRKGTWYAYVEQSDEGDWGTRVRLLKVIHKDYRFKDHRKLNESLAKFEVGVDSGQAGIFDVDHYKDDYVFGDKKPKFKTRTLDESGNKWYAFCCDATLYTKYTAGVIPYGAVSSSGFGDGGYPCIYWTDESGEIVKVAIGFIFDDNEDDIKRQILSESKS